MEKNLSDLLFSLDKAHSDLSQLKDQTRNAQSNFYDLENKLSAILKEQVDNMLKNSNFSALVTLYFTPRNKKK